MTPPPPPPHLHFWFHLFHCYNFIHSQGLWSETHYWPIHPVKSWYIVLSKIPFSLWLGQFKFSYLLTQLVSITTYLFLEYVKHRTGSFYSFYSHREIYLSYEMKLHQIAEANTMSCSFLLPFKWVNLDLKFELFSSFRNRYS